MLPAADTYDSLVAAFAWRIAPHYNIGIDACDKWADGSGRPALICETREGQQTRYTFDELKSMSDRFAHALRKRGVKKGDRVGIFLAQSVETALAHLAVYKCGAIAVPLFALFGPDALEYRLSDSGAVALVTDLGGAQKIASVRANLPELRTIFCVDIDRADDALQVESFWSALDDAPAAFEAEPTSADDPAVIIYTSGTTGKPKGALHAHRVLLGHLPGAELPHYPFPKDGDCFWTPADWAWAGGLLDVLLPSLRHGIPVVARKFDKFDPEEAFALIAKTNVRNAFIPPTALRMMRAAPSPSGRYTFALRSVASGGESLGIEALEWGKAKLGLTINEFYGQTECNLVLGSCAQLGTLKAGAIGKPIPGHVVAVIDRDGRPIKAGELGQIAVQRPDPVMFLEYWGRPEATRDKFIGDWMTTGDQGITDENGYITFVGRDDDVITSSGFRIGPGEVEDCLIQHPAVALAAAVGKPDPIRTEIVKAFIVLKKSYTPSDKLAAEIQSFVKTRLSAHEYPREVAFIDDMPMTTTGKIIRRLLRERT